MFGINMLNKKVDCAVRAYKNMDIQRHPDKCHHHHDMH